ncbi:AbfB domain-containing protein [Streptomyces sp. NPDC047461]|uniref:AbfB domain-containing protein n=1 Tax=Streptomyces sp. NPDC047461 TaxID=3155619 RepID=UPI003405B77A
MTRRGRHAPGRPNERAADATCPASPRSTAALTRRRTGSGVDLRGRAGLSDSSCVLFESANTYGQYLRHVDYTVHITSDGSSNVGDAASKWDDDISWVITQPWA